MLNEKIVESPFPDFPGRIVLPVELTPEQFDQVFAREQEIKTRKDILRTMRVFFTNFPLVLRWELDWIDAADIDDTGKWIPLRKIAAWIMNETDRLVKDAIDPPELAAPSSDSTNAAD